MKFRKLAVIAILLVFCATFAGVFFGGVQTADAAVTTGTSLFTSSTGSTTITSSLQEDGIKITYKTSAEDHSVRYKHNLDMHEFSVKLKISAKHFQTFYVLLTDPEDDGNNIVAEFSIGETAGTVNVRLGDALDAELQTTKSVETVLGTSDKPVEFDDVFELIYTADTAGFGGEFKVKVEFSDGTESEYVLAAQKDDVTVGFDWLHGTENQVLAPLMEATMKIGVTGQETSDNVGEDVTPINSVLFVQSIGNAQGVQGLTSADTVIVPPLVKFNNLEYRGQLVSKMTEAELETLFQKNMDGDYIYETIGAKGASYKFPFYTISVVGKGFDKITWSVTEEGGEPTETEVISSQTSKSLDSEVNAVYDFYFKVILDKGEDDSMEEDDTIFDFSLKVRVVKDEIDPVINNDALKAYVYSKITDMTINAPETGSYEFPVINTTLNISEGNLFTDKITEEEDNNFNNLTIVIGYKRPNTTNAWTYATSMKVTFNSVGTWAFVYKVTDQSGNETLSDVFLFDIQDVTPPTIKASDKDIVVGEILTVPTPTRSDNCVGVNTDKSVYRIWEWNDETKTKGAEITKSVKDKKFKPETIGDKYIVEYEAEDKVGNRSEIVSSILTVVKATAVTPDPNPVNDILIIVLIVIGTLVVVTLAIYLFMGKKEKKIDARENLIADDEDATQNENDKNNK